jgi:hypothetical protein
MNPQSASSAGGPWYGQPPRRVIALFAVIWTLLAIMATLVIHALDSPQQTNFAHIAAHPVATVGLVTVSDPSNHNSFLGRKLAAKPTHWD